MGTHHDPHYADRLWLSALPKSNDTPMTQRCGDLSDDFHAWSSQLCVNKYYEEDVILAAAAVIRPRRFRIRPSLKSLNTYSGSDLIKNLLSDYVDSLNLEYRCDAGFRNFFRMTGGDFETLWSNIRPAICRKNTTFRTSIPASKRLAVTL
ncbi:hypothetical protein PR048_014170 [Dryococelus australis]|uniref:Uncharacterized protein n=1 Tax=Dryococelus australis TaxID=614101 RepID=A0ABQ9HDV6_9NEOP|nr:hypothetical protein PR048_014170 [Dryococelus australis]